MNHRTRKLAANGHQARYHGEYQHGVCTGITEYAFDPLLGTQFSGGGDRGADVGEIG